jgi:O-Antigen ligase
MLYYAIAVGAICLIGFCLLRPRVKVFIAFVVMTSCFDLVPRIVLKIDVWDVGAILLLSAWFQLALRKTEGPTSRIGYVVGIRIILGWMTLCLLWSVLIYEYPGLNSVKASRQMIIGLLSFFVFKDLFAVDKGAYEFFNRALYVTTFILLPVCLVQFVLHQPLLFGLYREYGDVTRSLPIFLPVVLLYMWMIASKVLTATRIAMHEVLYAGMAIAVTLLTFTRGIYLAVLCVFGVLIFTLALRKAPGDIKINWVAVPVLFILFSLCGTGLYVSGHADKIVERFSSAVELVLEQKAKANKGNEDTYTGRLSIAKERFLLVLVHNPIIGYGFIHEDDVPRALRAKLKYGSVIYTPQYIERYQAGYPYVLALHSADIGWADIMINTGFVGLALWIFLFAAIVINFYATARRTSAVYYHARLAHFLQLIVGILLMFESNTFVTLVQIPAFILAGYWYCSNLQTELQSEGALAASMEMAPATA